MPKKVVTIVECDICAKEIDVSYGYNFIAVIGVPGHPDIEPFQQDHVESWACSKEHWLEVAHKDVEHMYEKLLRKHKELNNGNANNTV